MAVPAHRLNAPQGMGTLDRGGRESQSVSRVTISLPADIADYVRTTAEELSEPVSSVIASAIRWRREAELDALIVEALQENGERDRQLVAEWSVARPEILD